MALRAKTPQNTLADRPDRAPIEALPTELLGRIGRFAVVAGPDASSMVAAAAAIGATSHRLAASLGPAREIARLSPLRDETDLTNFNMLEWARKLAEFSDTPAVDSDMATHGLQASSARSLGCQLILMHLNSRTGFQPPVADVLLTLAGLAVKGKTGAPPRAEATSEMLSAITGFASAMDNADDAHFVFEGLLRHLDTIDPELAAGIVDAAAANSSAVSDRSAADTTMRTCIAAYGQLQSRGWKQAPHETFIDSALEMLESLEPADRPARFRQVASIYDNAEPAAPLFDHSVDDVPRHPLQYLLPAMGWGSEFIATAGKQIDRMTDLPVQCSAALELASAEFELLTPMAQSARLDRELKRFEELPTLSPALERDTRDFVLTYSASLAMLGLLNAGPPSTRRSDFLDNELERVFQHHTSIPES